MTALLLALLLCVDLPAGAIGADWISGERHIEGWTECPCPDVGVPCLIEMCPVYNAFRWERSFTTAPRFERTDCAEVPGSACYFLHPAAVYAVGPMSARPEITAEVWQGGCP